MRTAPHRQPPARVVSLMILSINLCAANRGAVLALRAAPQNQPPRVARNIVCQRAVPVLASD